MLSSRTVASVFSASVSQSLWAACRRTLAVASSLVPDHALFTPAMSSPLRSRSRRRSRKKDHWWAPEAKIVLPRASEADAISTGRRASADGYTEYSRLLPCPSINTAPRIEHLVVSEGGNVLDYISKALHLPSIRLSCVRGTQLHMWRSSLLRLKALIDTVSIDVADRHRSAFFTSRPLIDTANSSSEHQQSPGDLLQRAPANTTVHSSACLTRTRANLIQFGAIHYALVCPKPPPSATPEQVQIYREVTDPSVLQKRSSLKGKTVREAQKTYRIADANEYVEAGTYLRVHVHPKRFPRCYEVDWKSRIIAVTDSYVVIDKPAMTSVGGSSDNIEETCATFVSRALELDTLLKTTHQLDNCTEGCLVLAKTKEFCSVFHGMIREKQVKKLYLALVADPVPTGIISHYMRPVNLAPRLVSQEFIEGWHLCQLEVLECKEAPWPNADIVKTHRIEDSEWPSKKTAYECKINLLTGKTHQVRAQLAAIGAPIVGDSMYMPAAMAVLSNPRINPFRKRRKEQLSDEDKVAAMVEWISCHGKEPSSGIGLQASQVSWDDGNCSYEAGTPWWVVRE